MKSRRGLAAAMTTVALILWPTIALSWSSATGPQMTVTLFESDRHPGLPLQAFAAGRLGIIRETWATSYRYAAYRYLVGAGFDPAEQDALVSFWKARLGLPPSGDTPVAHLLQMEEFDTRYVDRALSSWLAVRNRVPGVQVINDIEVYRSAQSMFGGTFAGGFYYANCNNSSFQTATNTLQAMVAKFDIASPQVKSWVDAQDEVFDNCSNTAYKPPASVSSTFSPEAFTHNVDHWIAVRSKVLGFSASPGFTNGCSGETFEEAAIALEKMIHDLGASSPQVKQWLEAQDQIFDKCSHPLKYVATTHPAPSPAEHIPLPLTTGTRFEQAQRAYQIACAYFYGGNFDEAAQLFRAIATDRSSPWHDWGLYLAARATVRRATLSGPKNDPSILAQAAAQLDAIIKAAGDNEIKPAARRLLSFVEFRLNPQQRVDQVARDMLRPSSGQRLVQDLGDYSNMWGDGSKGADGFYFNDLTDWIANFRTAWFVNSGEHNGSLEHSIAQWKKTASMPWLVAAIAQVPASNPNVPALIDAAEKIQSGSPAYVTVTFHAARLLSEQGKRDQARTKLDMLLAMRGELSEATLNEIKRERMKLARNLNELLTYGQRTPLGVTDTGDWSELPSDLDVSWLAGASELKALLAGPLLDRDGAQVLSRWTPLSVQIRAAENPILRKRLRTQLALAAWTRAILLDDGAASREIAPVVIELVPDLKPSMDAWLDAKDRQERRFDAAVIMLTHPGVRPYLDPGVGRVTPLGRMDSFRDNWWRFPSWSDSALMGGTRRAPHVTYPLFLTVAQRKSADDQWRKLKTINAPDVLCEEAIAEARRKHKDYRVPLALYQCIQAVHYGYSNDCASGYAKLAFRLLHHQYPDSGWALTNRFWYRGGRCGPPNPTSSGVAR